MRELGRVVSVGDGRITVSVKRTAACDNCQKCSHAHIAFGDNDDLIVEAVPLGDVSPGETVELEMDNEDYLRISFLVYLMPVIIAFLAFGAGWLLGRGIGNPTLWGTVAGLAGLGLSFFWLNRYDKAANKAGRYLPLARPVRDL